MPAQNKSLHWVGVGTEINRGAADIFGKKQISYFPAMENSHWLKGSVSVITLTTANQDCVEVRFAAYSSSHHWHMPTLTHGTVVFLKRHLAKNKRNCNFALEKDEQKEAGDVLRGFCNLPSGFEESLMHQLCAMVKEMQMGRMLLLSLFRCPKASWRTKRRDGRGFLPSFCQQRRTCFCRLLEKRNTSLFPQDSGRCFGRKISKYHPRLSPIIESSSCIVVDECHTTNRRHLAKNKGMSY